MTRLLLYNQLNLAVQFGSTGHVRDWLRRHRCTVKHDIHAYFCAQVPAHATSCGSCETLLSAPLRRRQISMICELLGSGAYPSAEICATDSGYGRARTSTPLKRAVESGSLDDVRQLLTSPGAAVDDVNWHPRVCLQQNWLDNLKTCSACDTPLMAAVRRQDIAMIRLLIAHGACVSEEIYANFWYSMNSLACFSKTA